MRKTAVAARQAELAPSYGRAAWDREVLYASLIRWGAGTVVPITGRTAVGRARRKLLRAAARSLDVAPAWRRSGARRRVRDAAQVDRVTVDAAVEVLYGNIQFPVTSPSRATVWSTQGIPVGRRGTNPTQSARTHERFVAGAHAVHCWSRRGFEGLLAHAAVDAQKIHVIPPLIYVDVPEPAVRHDEDVLVLFVGGEARLKGVLALIEAFRGMGPGVRLEVISGESPPPELPGQVTWMGPMPRHAVLSKMASADALALPSTAESFGGVVVEALATGLPSIVVRGTVPEELAGDAGVLCEAEDAASIRLAIARVAGDVAARQSLSGVARARYVSTFAPDVVGPQIEAMIDAAYARFNER